MSERLLRHFLDVSNPVFLSLRIGDTGWHGGQHPIPRGGILRANTSNGRTLALAETNALTNREMADIFETTADLLQLKGENIHRVLAYRNAAASIRELARDIRAVAAEGKLLDIEHIGPTLAEKIQEMVDTGHLEFFEKLRAEIP